MGSGSFGDNRGDDGAVRGGESVVSGLGNTPGDRRICAGVSG